MLRNNCKLFCVISVMIRTRPFLAFLFVFLQIQNVHAQRNADSLKALLSQPAHDTLRMDRLDLLINSVGPTEEGQAYNEEMGALSKTLMDSDEPLIASAATKHYASYLGNSGYMAELSGDIPGALKFYGEAQNLISADNPNVQATLLNNIGYVYEGLGDIPKAIEYYQISLRIRDSIGDKYGIATSYNNLAALYRDQGEYEQALEYFLKFSAVTSEIKDSAGMCLALVNIGTLYQLMGDTLKAKQYLNEGLQLSEVTEDEREIGHALYGLGMLSFSQGHYTEARKYYENALSHQKISGHKRSMANTMFSLAETNLLLGEKETALTIALEAHDIANKTGYVELIATSAATLKEIYKSTGQDSLALVMFELEVKMRDSIKNESNRKIIVRNALENEYQLKKNELDQKSERETLLRNAALCGLGIVLIFLVFVVIQRNRISRERKRSDDLLLNILPAEVAEELKEKGHAETRAFDEVTILFTDFKDFSIAAENIPAKELVEELDICFKAFDAIIDKYGIEKIKTIGDSYMAVGGIPAANKTHAMDVTNAAIEIRDFMLRHSNELRTKGKDTFEIRIGIHTGPVVAGIVGIKKFAYDIWGDTVNIASRMESSGEAGKVNISGTTFASIKDHFKCDFRGKIPAKNKGEIAMYFADRKKSG